MTVAKYATLWRCPTTTLFFRAYFALTLYYEGLPSVVLFLIDQPINQGGRFDPVIGCVHARIQGEDDLLLIVPDLLQESRFLSAGVLVCHGLGNLNMGLSFTQQEIHRTNDFDAVLVLRAFMDSVTWMYFFSSVWVAIKSTSLLSSLQIKSINLKKLKFIT